MFNWIRTFWKESTGLPAPPLTEKNLPDQTGKVFIVTGANTGVGYEVSSILYSHNAKVYVAARSESKAQAAIDAIKALHPKSTGSLHYLHLNLSDLGTIKSSVNEFLSKEDKLHWLNNNAGVMIPPKEQVGAQGLNLTYQTNILGPFLFTKLLLPVLQRTADSEPKGTVRVSWAGSLAVVLQSPPNGHKWKIAKDGSETLDDTLRNENIYGVSKAANYYLANEFGRRYNAQGVMHNSYNPGNLQSDLQRHLPGFVQWIMNKTVLYPAIYGAYTEIYSGLSRDNPALTSEQGVYLVPWGRKYGTRADLEAEIAKGPNGEAAKLWDWCDRVTKDFA
ncbi:hypothetical protein LTR84_005584 [Exophiala bonariae]|uniref:NAD(P)-binding protein n=1 Tax=Exophiala bonariae TaxID=1690606 RepID=A0AAV9N342_9EURO|nr:hypothetical protein LTR84_005584 [Exophiala bonariae]